MNDPQLTTPFEDDAFLASSEALPRRPRRHLDALHGAAHLADEADLAPWLAPSPRVPHGTSIGHFAPIVEDLAVKEGLCTLFNRTWCIPEETRNRHFLIVGQPGTGKTTGFILNFLWADLGDPERSVIVFDAKGELAPFVHAAARELGRKRPVLVLNFADRSRSLGWNPLETLPTDAAGLESRTYTLAHALCWATEVREQSHDSVFFINSAINLIAGVMQGLATDPGERPCFARVREVLELPRDEFFAWAKEHGTVPGLINFQSYLKSASWNAETVLADAQMRLAVFRDHDLASVTSKNEIDLDQLVDAPGVLVIEMREADIPRLRPIWNLFCASLVDHLTARSARAKGARLPRPVALVLDEFASSLGRLPNFEIAVNTLRGPRVAILAAVQSLGQVAHLYRGARDAVLAGFNNKVFLAGLERVDAEYAAALAGTMSSELVTLIEEEDKRKPGTFRVTARHRSSAPRPLLFPEEIARPPRHFMLGAPATFFLIDTPPFQAYVTRAYELEGPREVLRALASEGAGAAASMEPAPALSEAARKGQLLWRPARRPATVLGRHVPEAVLQARVERLKSELAFERASLVARAWWMRYEQQHKLSAAALVQLLEQLKEDASNLDDLHTAHRVTKREEVKALVHYVRYQRAVRELDLLAAKEPAAPEPTLGAWTVATGKGSQAARSAPDAARNPPVAGRNPPVARNASDASRDPADTTRNLDVRHSTPRPPGPDGRGTALPRSPEPQPPPGATQPAADSAAEDPQG